MKFQITLFLSIVIEGLSLSQEFQTTFYLSNNQGWKDSISIGYDPNAGEGIDPVFNEIDLSDLPMNSFEIRAGQVYVEQLTIFEDLEHPLMSNLAQYAGKTEILPKNCLSPIPVTNQAGFTASINLFIKTDAYPVYIKWNKNDFTNICVSESFITDWPITTWWDIPCCNNLEINETLLASKDSIIINSHVGINLTDLDGDTVTMLTLLLVDEFGTGILDPTLLENSKITPNPSNGVFSIPQDFHLITLTNELGSKIKHSINGSYIQSDYTGLMLVTLESGGEITVLKQINSLK